MLPRTYFISRLPGSQEDFCHKKVSTSDAAPQSLIWNVDGISLAGWRDGATMGEKRKKSWCSRKLSLEQYQISTYVLYDSVKKKKKEYSKGGKKEKNMKK